MAEVEGMVVEAGLDDASDSLPAVVFPPTMNGRFNRGDPRRRMRPPLYRLQ